MCSFPKLFEWLLFLLLMSLLGGCVVGGDPAGDNPYPSSIKHLYLKGKRKKAPCQLAEVRRSTSCSSGCKRNDIGCLYLCWDKHLSRQCQQCTVKRFEGERGKSCLLFEPTI